MATNESETVTELRGFLMLVDMNDERPAERWRFVEGDAVSLEPVLGRPAPLESVVDSSNPTRHGKISYAERPLTRAELATHWPSFHEPPQTQAWWTIVAWVFQPKLKPREVRVPSCDLFAVNLDPARIHILRNGDQLQVFDGRFYVPPKLMRNETVSIEPYNDYNYPEEGLNHPCGQAGVPRDEWSRWFFRNYPARLRTNRRCLAPKP